MWWSGRCGWVSGDVNFVGWLGLIGLGECCCDYDVEYYVECDFVELVVDWCVNVVVEYEWWVFVFLDCV